MLEEMAARLQASEREIVHLKEASNSQSIGPSSTAIQEDASQSSFSQNPQANLRQLHDLETQLAELQASNSELKANLRRLHDLETQLAESQASNSELKGSSATFFRKLKASNSELRASNTELKALLSSSKKEADAFRAEILELKKSLVAAKPVQKPQVS
jgi:small-conductance mechanosensitive channel